MKTLWCIANEDGELTAPREIAVAQNTQDETLWYARELIDGCAYLSVRKSKCHPTALAAWTAYEEALKDEIDHLMVEFVNAGIKIKELSTAQPESPQI